MPSLEVMHCLTAESLGQVSAFMHSHSNLVTCEIVFHAYKKAWVTALLGFSAHVVEYDETLILCENLSVDRTAKLRMLQPN